MLHNNVKEKLVATDSEKLPCVVWFSGPAEYFQIKWGQALADMSSSFSCRDCNDDQNGQNG